MHCFELGKETKASEGIVGLSQKGFMQFPEIL